MIGSPDRAETDLAGGCLQVALLRLLAQEPVELVLRVPESTPVEGSILSRRGDSQWAAQARPHVGVPWAGDDRDLDDREVEVAQDRLEHLCV